MEQNSGAMNSQSMVKSGDQPRMSQKDVQSMRQPPSMSFNRNAFKGAVRNTPNRTSGR
jgi:hypothetical protein